MKKVAPRRKPRPEMLGTGAASKAASATKKRYAKTKGRADSIVRGIRKARGK